MKKDQDKTMYLYTIRDRANTNVVRYVGVTQDVDVRLNSHCNSKKSPIGSFIDKCRRTGKKLVLRIEGEVPYSEAFAAEAELIKKFGKSRSLLNINKNKRKLFDIRWREYAKRKKAT